MKKSKRVTCAVTPEIYQVFKHLSETMEVSVSQAIAFHLDLTKEVALEVTTVVGAKQKRIEEEYTSTLVKWGGIARGLNDKSQ